MGFAEAAQRGPPMTIPKFRAAILVFLVGFALGLSVFVASRLFVRAILSGDAIAAAEELATQLADEASAVEPSGALSSVVRYTYFDLDGKVVASDVAGRRRRASRSAAERKRSRRARRAPSARAAPSSRKRRSSASLLGLSESAIKRVAVPVVHGRRDARHPLRRGRPDAGARIARAAPSASSAW